MAHLESARVDAKVLTVLGSSDAAYDQIKNRKGTLLANGVFVKEE
jgi:hypothetical protein